MQIQKADRAFRALEIIDKPLQSLSAISDCTVAELEPDPRRRFADADHTPSRELVLFNTHGLNYKSPA